MQMLIILSAYMADPADIDSRVFSQTLRRIMLWSFAEQDLYISTYLDMLRKLCYADGLPSRPERLTHSSVACVVSWPAHPHKVGIDMVKMVVIPALRAACGLQSACQSQLLHDWGCVDLKRWAGLPKGALPGHVDEKNQQLERPLHRKQIEQQKMCHFHPNRQSTTQLALGHEVALDSWPSQSAIGRKYTTDAGTTATKTGVLEWFTEMTI